MSVDRVRERVGFAVRWTAFPLHPETPAEGRLLRDLFSVDPAYIESMWPRLQAEAAELGVPFRPQTHTFNSRNASELAKWVEERGAGARFHLAAYQAYFARGENISMLEVLEAVVKEAGLDPSGVKAILEGGEYRQSVDEDWDRSRKVGVTAVPTIMKGDRKLVGYYPPSDVLAFFRGLG